MKDSFADTLKQFRTEKNLSQQQLADMLFVERSTIANWETGRRIPDAVLLLRISKCLDIDINILLETIDNTVEEPNIIMVDDESIILKGGMSVIGHFSQRFGHRLYFSDRSAVIRQIQPRTFGLYRYRNGQA